MGEIVYVRWYRDILQGEVVENDRMDQLAGMVAVRIPIQGVRVTALFTPEHVYSKWEEAANVTYPISFPEPADIIHFNLQHVYQLEVEAEGNSPIISSNPPKVATEAREISRKIQKSTEIICKKIQDSSKNICSEKSDAIITQVETDKSDIASSKGWKMIQQFKAEHWDHEHNHLRIDALDEFYRIWLKTHGKRSVTLPSHKMEPKSRIVSDKRMEQLKSQLKKTLKPQKKTVQLDLFS